MGKILTIKENILQYIENQNIVKEDFYRNTGISASNFKGLGLKSEIGGDKIVKILSYYDNISAEWLLTGRGPMLKENIDRLEEPKSVYRLKTDNNIDDQAIPLYNLEATAGIVSLFKDSRETEPVDYIQIPNLPKCDGAVYVSGDSMYPLLKSGDIVMYKQIHNIKDNIYWGEMYLISVQDDGNEMVMVKYIKRSEKEGYITLVSQNKHHQDREVLLKKVKALALIKASIRINSMS